MGIADKLLNTVGGLYATFNPITLSGVNDVIVVKDRDGSMRCSPFHVRFSRLLFQNMRAQVVHVYVNGRLTEIKMSISSQGDVMFANKCATTASDDQCVFPPGVSLESIVEQRYDFPQKRSEESKKRVDRAIVYDRRVYSASTVDLDPVTPQERVLDDICVGLNSPQTSQCSPDRPFSSSSALSKPKAADAFDRQRLENLSLRIFAMHNLPCLRDGLYSSLADKYSRVGSLLSSADHYDALLGKATLLTLVVESLIAMSPSASIAFSVCSNSRIEGSIDETFASYLVTEIESPETTVVRIEMPIGCPGNTSQCNCVLGSHVSIHKVIRFYLPYLTFTRLFFEVRCAKNTILNYSNSITKTRPGTTPPSQLSASSAAAADDRSKVFYSLSDLNSSNISVATTVSSPCKKAGNGNGNSNNTSHTFSTSVLHRVIEFLEREYNKALGWNIFGKRPFIKRNVGFSLSLSSEELRSLGLVSGKNDIVFKISGMKRQLEGSIFLWDVDDKVVISDIDGTITKSDIRGHLYGFVGKDWTHTGVAGLFSRISRNGYKILYLTAQPLGQSSATKSYLKAVSQGSFSLPEGPVLLSPSGVFEAIYREVIIRKPEIFKIECLRGVRELFGARNPFVAGFGNRVSDVFAYETLGIPKNRIYTINPNGQLVAEYTRSLVGTYHTMNEFVDSIFPSLHVQIQTESEYKYGDFGWWIDAS